MMDFARRSTIVTGLVAAATVLALAGAPVADAVIAPRVTGVSPTGGYTAGGNRVTVSGSGFTHVAAVYFGATKGSAIRILSTGRLTVTAPAHVDGRVDVRVKTTTAESAIVTADHYTYRPTPVSAVTVLGVTSRSVALSWVNPRDPYLSQIVIRRSAAGSSTPPTLSTGVAVATLAKTVTTATAQGLSAGSAYAFSVFARDTNGHYAAAATKATHTIAWVLPAGAPTDPSQGFPTALSCSSTTFCAMVDQLGTALTYNGSGWSNQQKVSLTNRLTGVSCTSTTFCVAVGSAGFAATYDGTGWTASSTGDANDFNAVSCTTTTFCVAVDVAGNGVTFDGTGWTSAAPDPSNALTAVSCVGTTFCTAVDNFGSVFTFNGATWSPYAGNPVFPTSFSSVSCASTTMCVAIADLGKPWVFDGTTWTEHDTNTLSSAGPVSCASTTWCLAADIFGNSQVWNGSAWGSPHNACGGQQNCSTILTGLSCPVVANCVAVDGNSGGFLTYTSDWSNLAEGDDFIVPTGIACPTTTFCALSDTFGRALLYNGVTWGSPTPIFAELDSLSCPTATFCIGAAVIDVATFSSGTWTFTQLEGFGTGTINDVSCASPTFCAAVDTKGRVAFFNGTKWSALGTVDPDSLTAVSCSGPRLCVAADAAGRLLNFNGSTWSSPTYADTYNRVTRVRCVGVSFCAAVDDAGNALYFNGSSWSGLTNIASGLVVSGLSCISTRFCYATTSSSVIGFGPGLAAVAASLPSHGAVTNIACNAAPMCMVVDNQGETIKGA